MAKETLNDEKVSPKKGDGLSLLKGGIKQTHSGGSDAAGKGGHAKGSSGLARIMEPEKNDDEFAKGSVGAPDELDAIRSDGNQGGMKPGDTFLFGGGYFENETVGLEDGVSAIEIIDADASEPNYNYDIDPMTGNAPERKVGRENNHMVKGKRDSFLMGEF